MRTIERSLSFIGARPQLPPSAVGIAAVRGGDITEMCSLKPEEELVWHVGEQKAGRKPVYPSLF